SPGPQRGPRREWHRRKKWALTTPDPGYSSTRTASNPASCSSRRDEGERQCRGGARQGRRSEVGRLPSLRRMDASRYNGGMAKRSPPPPRYLQPYRYPSPNIPLSAIRRFARQIAEKFHPEKIILFGSYAYGTPHAESDVDLLVIMPASNEISQAIRITLAFDPPFALDLIVRTPKHVERGLRENDWFLREVIEKGKVLYEAPNRAVGAQG